MRRALNVVAMPPYIRELREVGVKVFLGAFFQTAVHQKTQRHGGKGLGADQLAFFPVRQRLAVVTRHDHRHAQSAGLNLAAPDRVHGRPGDEASHQIGAARQGTEADVGLHLAVDVVEAFGRQRRAGRHEGAKIAEAVRVHRRDARLAQRLDELGRGAEVRETHRIGVVEQNGVVAHTGRAVVKANRGPLAERRHQPIPHHPAASGEEEHAVFGMNIDLQPHLGQMLEQHPARAMHNAFRRPGGAA